MAGALSSCRSEPRYAVDRLVVADTEAAARLGRAGVPAEALRDEAQRLLAAAPGFVAPDRARGARHLLGQVIVQRAEAFTGGQGGAAVAHVIVTIELAPKEGEDALRETGRAAEPLGDAPDALRGALDRAARTAVGRAVAAFSVQMQAARKGEADLVSDLTSPEATVRDQAVRALAERGAKDAVPALMKRLKDSDPAVVERTVGALAQLHDPRAVPALIALTRHRDGPYVANMVRIVGDLGGPDARAWLVTLASGHPDDVVRGAASEALAELAARAPAPQAAAKRTP